MSTFTVGRRVPGALQRVNIQALRIQAPKIYELHIETTPTTQTAALAAALSEQLPGAFYVSVSDTATEVQLIADPFTWTAILAMLPQIFTLLGIGIVTIAVFLITGSIPSWAYALAIGGAFMIFFVPYLLRRK